MQRLLLLLLKALLSLTVSLILLVLALWAGFRQHFPGEAVADFLEDQVARQAGIQLEIEPLQLEWTQLQTPSVSLLRPPQLNLLPLETLLQLDEFSFPFAPLFQERELWLQAQLYGGRLQISAELPSIESVRFSLKDLALQQVPLANAFALGFPAGLLQLEGEILNLRQLQQQLHRLPVGEVRGSLTDFRFRLNQENPLLNGWGLTELKLKEVLYEVELQQQLIEIRKLTLSGDLEGNLSGNIRLNERNLLESRLDLNLRVKLSEELQGQLGALRLMLQSFQCGDYIDIQLRGTFRRLNPPQRNRCT